MIVQKMISRVSCNRKSLRLVGMKPCYKYSSQFVREGKQKLVGGWLFLTATGVLCMIVLGGYTRLSHAGLSMVDWKPLTSKYPQNDKEWNIQFDKYKKSIEYKTVNREITLDKFKIIYKVQFIHRKIGIFLGFWFLIPLTIFAWKGHITSKLRNRMVGLLGLGGLQGVIGWWMVSSGLEQKPDYQSRPRVSPYRLTVHLMTATTIYAGLLWHSFHLLVKPIQPNITEHVAKINYLKKIRRIGIVMLKCLLLNIFTGALVAGIDAGSIYNTWPLMNGAVIPSTAFEREPLWRNFFQNKALVQFNHRTMAYLTQLVSFYLMYVIMKNKIHTPASYAGIICFALVNYQALSGIITLLNLVPTEKASLHQTTAMITLSSVMLMIYLARVPKIRPI